jgi:hypothetical protein
MMISKSLMLTSAAPASNAEHRPDCVTPLFLVGPTHHNADDIDQQDEDRDV